MTTAFQSNAFQGNAFQIGAPGSATPEDQSGQTIGWDDDPCVIEEAIEDPGAMDFVGVAPLAADVIPDDQVTMWTEPESEEAPDISPLDWYFATAPPEEYDVPPPAYADDTDDGSETDPAPFVYVGSLAADEHDTPAPAWNEDTDDGREGDVAAWDFVSSLATDEHDVPAPALAEVDGDDDAPDVSPWDFAAAGIGEDAVVLDEPLPQFAAADDTDEPDSDAAYDFSGWSQPEDVVIEATPQLAVVGGYPGALKKRKKPRDEIVTNVAMVIAADAPEIADPRAIAVKIVAQRPQRFQVIDDRALALIRAELIDIQAEIAKLRQAEEDEEEDLEILLLGG